MKKNKTVFLGVFFLVCILALVALTYKSVDSPPSVESVQNHYHEHSEEIQIIIDFLLSMNYEDISIRDNDGLMLADLNVVAIDEHEVRIAIDGLLANRAFYHIVKNGNTIYLLQWKGIRDVGCGIAYSINGIDSPEIEYVTQLVPLSIDGWFYYVSDYEEWRSTR